MRDREKWREQKDDRKKDKENVDGGKWEERRTETKLGGIQRAGTREGGGRIFEKKWSQEDPWARRKTKSARLHCVGANN